MPALPRPLLLSRNNWRRWLEKNHSTSSGIWLRIYKKQVSRGLQYADAVEEALCFGWVDGQLRRIDDRCHLIRFTPRQLNSVWAPSNISRVKKLIRAKKMTAAGLKIYRLRKPDQQTRPDVISGKSLVIPLVLKRALVKNHLAWLHWQNRSPSNRRLAIWWVRSAKRPDTRVRRVKIIVEDAAKYAKPRY